ncbi:Ribosomal protein S25 like protein [Aduncisulcus paluster]|uniref:40S ribosomal protein S25 n=1 Tax=Aduncisulcus paluster TaxID=2918883 RepID=A0ABQ5K3S5_9EUKA|nr:Ribosomal protein S25 like protein [Aduncisulcus paluster]
MAGKKWSKEKSGDKVNHAILLKDKAAYDRVERACRNSPMISISELISTHKINGSLARRCLKELEEKGAIVPVIKARRQVIYRGAPKE